ncbi:hypothetical protein KPH14_001000 [Odynerus spinipes]|uniref:Pre-C2HC domain-containing protein n=1 Tax=Odynerus spinipes TaxID=1348599 RepID=A0AAD9VMT1_9HYME|nr:hypothetical protein KPH14_001000 [Odynerus spinipes]
MHTSKNTADIPNDTTKPPQNLAVNGNTKHLTSNNTVRLTDIIMSENTDTNTGDSQSSYISKRDIQDSWELILKKNKINSGLAPLPTVGNSGSSNTDRFTYNNFEILQNVADDKEMEIEPKPKKPQPIIKIEANNTVRIQPETTSDYRKIRQKLEQLGIEYNTFQLKEDRPFRVVIRNLHPTTDPENIAEELRELGHNTSKLPYNVKHRVTKQPLPIFFVDLIPKENNKDIYSLSKLQYTKITVEPPRIKKELVQCKRCQRHGHTQKYCTRTPRCVKCTGDHFSTECSRNTRDENVRCTNCGEKHPAVYKGCVAYITAWNKKYKPYNQYQSHDKRVETRQYKREGLSYASVTKQPTTNTTEKEDFNYQINNNNTQHKNEEITLMMSMMTEMKNLISEQTKQVNLLLTTLNHLLVHYTEIITWILLK